MTEPCQCEPGCEIPYGYCHDGCGEKTPPYQHTNRTTGAVKGEPRRYLWGHATIRKGPRYEERDLGYVTPCWFWLGKPNKGGYGHYDANRSAHKAYYEMAKGPVPEGLGLDHLCHNADKTCVNGPKCLHRRCVNPDHLKPGTQAANHRAGSRTRLTMEQARDIRSRPRHYGSQAALAREFGVHPTTIHQILKNLIWVDPDYSGT